jgi:Spy/CpxP family protein refolding chaperone
MKTLTRIALLMAALAVAAIPVISIANAAVAADGTAKHPRLRALLQRRQAVRQHVAKKLDLSADQISQFKAERAKIVTEIKSIRDDTSLTREQKRAKVRETVQAARAEMRGVLTPEQQTKVKHMRERLRHFRGGK